MAGAVFELGRRFERVESLVLRSCRRILQKPARGSGRSVYCERSGSIENSGSGLGKTIETRNWVVFEVARKDVLPGDAWRSIHGIRPRICPAARIFLPFSFLLGPLSLPARTTEFTRWK